VSDRIELATEIEDGSGNGRDPGAVDELDDVMLELSVDVVDDRSVVSEARGRSRARAAKPRRALRAWRARRA
jgi:hypothetical protein